jgi:nucleotide-binding STING sensor domain-containing protein
MPSSAPPLRTKLIRITAVGSVIRVRRWRSFSRAKCAKNSGQARRKWAKSSSVLNRVFPHFCSFVLSGRGRPAICQEARSKLPSTSLAIGYYDNFLRRVFEAFERSGKIRIIEKDAKGKKVSDWSATSPTDARPSRCRFHSNLVELDQDSFKRRAASLKRIVVETGIGPSILYRGRFCEGRSLNCLIFPPPCSRRMSRL